MNVQKLAAHVVALVAEDETLADVIGTRIYLGLPEAYPAITLDGISCANDKLGRYLLNINLLVKSDASTSSDFDFYDHTERLTALLNTSPALVGGDWLPRHEPEQSLLRALYPVTAFLNNLD